MTIPSSPLSRLTHQQNHGDTLRLQSLPMAEPTDHASTAPPLMIHMEGWKLYNFPVQTLHRKLQIHQSLILQ